MAGSCGCGTDVPECSASNNNPFLLPVRLGVSKANLGQGWRTSTGLPAAAVVSGRASWDWLREGGHRQS